MGLMAHDLPMDAYYPSASGQFSMNPPAVHSDFPEREDPAQMFSLYQGSGGKAASLLYFAPSGVNKVINVGGKFELAVKEIGQAFGFTMEDLAKVCGVQSRKTLYNWINGIAEPRKSSMIRIFDLLITARAWKSCGFVADRKRLHAPVMGDQSVFDLLRQPQINTERVLFAGSRLNLMSRANDHIPDPFL